MAEALDVYWSFRSPYSYLVTPDLLQIRREFDVDSKLRVVLPVAVRTKETLFVSTHPPFAELGGSRGQSY